jgi:endonuclease V-like protein UPF0215 family
MQMCLAEPMKDEVRILGIDDASFDKFNDITVRVIGVFFRGGAFLDGVISTLAQVDGDDATQNIIRMINNTKFKPQTQCIMLDGIAVGGFNIIDVVELNQQTSIPVIVVMRHYPDFPAIEKTLRDLGMEHKIILLKKAGEITQAGKLFIQRAGISLQKSQEFLTISCTRSYVPEPIRVAHLIGQGMTYGESRGRA